MEKLRGEKGCPWDKEQTKESLKPFILEEAYELIDAVDEGDPEKIKEELGDLLFQIVFQCQIASEEKEFDMYEVTEKIGKKMIARHPHVFGNANYKTKDEVLIHWEEQKRQEGKFRASILEGVPETAGMHHAALDGQRLTQQVEAGGNALAVGLAGLPLGGGGHVLAPCL